MSRGARGDLKVLRSFRAKGAGGAPEGVPQEVRDGGDAILAKMNKIKSFVKDQRTRETKGNAKKQWLANRERLREEFIAAERDLLHTMSDLSESRCHVGEDIAQCAEFYEHSKYRSSLAAHQLMDEVAELREMAAVAGNAASRREGHGAVADLEMARDSLYFTRSEYEQQVQELGEEAAALQEDLRRDWPSVLGNGADNDPLHGLAHIGEVQQLLRKYMDASQDARTQAREACQALEAKYGARMDNWQIEFNTSEQGLHRPTGGWPAEEHSAFVRERAEAVVAAGGAGREAYLKRIAVMLPGRSMRELLEHDDWFLQRKLMLDRRKTLREAWLRERKQLLGAVRGMLQRSAMLEATQARSAAELLKWEAAQEALRAELAALQEAKAAEQAAVAEERARLEAAAAAREAKRLAQRQREMEQKKQLISQYREENMRLAEGEREEAAARAADEAAHAAVQAEANRERVDYRAVLWEMKLEEQERKQQDQERERAEQERRLDALRAQVAVDAERDPARLRQPTSSSAAEDSSSPAVFARANGFTDEHLFKDQRFKMTVALGERGLLGTKQAQSYTSRMLAGAHTYKPARVDNLTTLQRQGAAPGLP
eukprot:jgi/Tetstr1/427017/TSEL_017222.t1